MSGAINIVSPVEKKIVCMEQTMFDPVMRFWQDAAHTVPIPLAGKTFRFTVRDKSGTIILDMTLGSGLTIQNTNELAFNNNLATVSRGSYRYTFLITDAGVTRPPQHGDFIVLKNEART